MQRTRMIANAEPLTAPQREAARLAAQGRRPSEIADAIGVARSTMTAWRRLPAFREAVDRLAGMADALAVEDARAVRADALDVLRLALRKARAMLEGDPLPAELAVVGRMAIDAYRATEPTAHPSDESEQIVAIAKARSMLRAELEALPDDVLDRLSEGDP